MEEPGLQKLECRRYVESKGRPGGSPKGWKHRNWAGETQCAGSKQFLHRFSLYSHGLGSVRTGHSDSPRIRNQSDFLLEAQEERAGLDMGSEDWFWLSEIR